VKSVDRAIVSLSNMTVRARRTRTPADRLLLVVPHCLQNSRCEVRLDTDLTTCRLCGRCQVKDLIRLAEQYGIRRAIATGGELALERTRDESVRAVVAVACEKELRQGILAAFPKAVLGVVNERPCGPCKDTRVKLADVRRAIEWFLRSGSKSQKP
jgi:hypothetical protein